MKHKKDTQILSKWNDSDFKLYAKTKTKKKELIGTNNKGEEQEETVNFFSYCLLLVQLCNPPFPAAMPSEIATMIIGRPTHIDKK